MLIIYSGGLDSTVLLYQYKQYIKTAVTFNYGSKHNDMEYRYAKYHIKKLNKDGFPIKHLKVNMKFLKDILKSNLLKGGEEIPDGHYESIVMKKTVVPFRNGIMLSVAVGIAESEGLNDVLIANHAGDHTIYPDCRPEFIKGMNNASFSGTWKGIKILAPYIVYNKTQIALRGQELNIELHKTYSCYKGGQTHCGTCGTCIERKEAMKGFDKTIYLKLHH